MKITTFSAVLTIVTLSNPLSANEFTVCQSDLTKQMKRFEKTAFTVPQKLPTGNLREHALKMEILCPWQVEIDLNGDKQTDWVGIIHRQKQFELVAYFSAGKSYTTQVLHQYKFFPEQTYLKVSKKAVNKKVGYMGKKFIYDIEEVTLNDTSRIYSLKSNQYKVIKQYEDETILDDQLSDDISEDRRDID